LLDHGKGGQRIAAPDLKDRVKAARQVLARFIGRWWEMGHPPNRFADWQQRLNLTGQG
jgi:hypothetical protein